MLLTSKINGLSHSEQRLYYSSWLSEVHSGTSPSREGIQFPYGGTSS